MEIVHKILWYSFKRHKKYRATLILFLEDTCKQKYTHAFLLMANIETSIAYVQLWALVSVFFPFSVYLFKDLAKFLSISNIKC